MQCSDIDLEMANKAIEAARHRAQQLGISQNICIVDRGANLKAFIRMDNAWQGSIDIALKKAKTARLFDMPTAQMGKMSQPGKDLYGIELSNGGLISFGGGMPIENAEGEIIGAIGVSGSTVDNDEACAEAAVEAISGKKLAGLI